MSEIVEVFETLKGFVGFSADDVKNLKELRPIFVERGPAITDRFYATLANYPDTAKLIEGRVDALKQTHMRWMLELFDGDYGAAYLDRRLMIGKVHVRIGLSPYWVEGVMSVVREEGLRIVAENEGDSVKAAARFVSLQKLLDLDLLIINLAYGEERLDRIVKITGMSRKLVERLISKAGES
jgi:hypothetical protein